MQLDHLSLEEKIGQLFVVTTPEQKLTGELIHLVTGFHISGLLVRDENVVRPQQLRNLHARLQMYAHRERPLFLISDRFSNNYVAIEKQMLKSFTKKELGTINNRLYTKQYASYKGKGLYELGINTLLTNPLTISTSHSASFSDNPRHVAQHCEAMIAGLNDAQLKAFVTIDEQQIEELVQVSLEGKRLVPSDSLLYPLYKVLKNNDIGIHIPLEWLQNIEKNEQISHLFQVLHEQFSFANVHATSMTLQEQKLDEQMEAIKRAIQHGCKLFIINGTYKAQIKLIESVREAVLTHEIEEETIDRAVMNVLRMKENIHVQQLEKLKPHALKPRLASELTDKLAEQLPKLE